MTVPIVTGIKGFDYHLIREDGRLERVCKHGIGHTVGHIDSKQLSKRYTWVHGCDGCCDKYATQMPDKFDDE